jgi:hypothetical protein
LLTYFCFDLLATVGKNLSSRKLFAFAITQTDDFCKLASCEVRFVPFKQLISLRFILGYDK